MTEESPDDLIQLTISLPRWAKTALEAMARKNYSTQAQVARNAIMITLESDGYSRPPKRP